MAVAITTDLGGITNFDIHGDPTTVGARWKKWKRSFELFVVGKGVQDAAQKKALLLHCGGPQMQDVYYTFPEAREPGESETVYTVAMGTTRSTLHAPSQYPLRETTVSDYGSVTY